MSNTFRLRQLLDLRRRTEEEKAIALATVEAEQQHSRAALQQLLAQEASQLASMAAVTRGAVVDPTSVEAARQYLQHLEASIQRQRQQLAEVSARVEASRAELVEATRETRLLEQMEVRHDESVAAAANRRENTAIDEMAAQRHQRLRRTEG